MKQFIIIIKALIIVVITATNSYSQTLTNSIPNDGCRTSASGTLTVSATTALWWEEGEMLGSTFYPVVTYNAKSKTFNYSTTAFETYYRARVGSAYSTVIRIRNFYPMTLTGSVSSIGNVNGSPTLNGSLSIDDYCGLIIKWQSSLNGTAWTDIAHTGPSYTFSNLTQATYFRVVGDFCTSNSFQINFPQPVAGTLSGAATLEESGTGSITLVNALGSVRWQSSPDGTTWTDISGASGSPYQYTAITSSIYYRAAVSSYGWPDVYSNNVFIDIKKVGILSGPSSIFEDGVAAISLTGYNATILGWEYSTNNGTTWSSEDCVEDIFNYPISLNTKFRVKLDLGSFGVKYSNEHTVTVNTSSSFSQENPVTGVAGQNYVRQQQVTVPGITTLSQVDALTESGKHESFSYMDGLGRAMQTIGTKASPLQKDLVGFSAYDQYGQNPKQFLPYVSSTSTGAYVTNPTTAQTLFYANGTTDKIEDSAYPFAEVKFDSSPLFRVTEQSAPGTAWQMGSGHTVRSTITTNAANEVRLFNADGTSTSFYTANELVVSEITDADNLKRQTVSDKFGRTILTKVQLDETIGGTMVAWLETYYIYYPDGNIKYMISPKGVEALKTGSWSFTQAIKDQYVYQFTYDNLGRLVEKKTPGQVPIYYCYDRLNRLVLLQDGNIRPQNKWFFIKYDRLGRPVMQGLYTNTTYTTRATIQINVVDPLFSSPTAKYYEERGTVSLGYTNQIFPTTSKQVLTVNYYDSYDFDYVGGNDFAYTVQSLAGEGTPATTTLSLPTGSKRLILETSTWLSEYYFYDADGRVIQKRSNNHLSAAIDNLVTMVYDFEGKRTLQKTYHKTSSNTTTVLNRLVYDHMGRTKEIWQSNDGAAEQRIALYEYNELGQLVDKKLHDMDGSQFLQSVDFRYNIRGWLKSINNAELTSDGVKNDDPDSYRDDYFGMEFLHNETETGVSTSPLFGGNISAIKWKGSGSTSGATGQRKYSFTYDKADRLKSAVSAANNGSGWSIEDNALNEAMTYDHNGNLLTLQRNQRNHQLSGVTASYVFEQIDNLTYTYSGTIGDQLLKVTDASASAVGFNNGGSNTSNDFTYDAHGNMLSDLNKSISSVVYNELGKAKQVNFTDGRKIDYVFDAAGTKLTMKTWQGATLVSTTDYVNGFVYENNTLSFFASPEGRVVKNGSTLEYQYSIADNQGNTRVVFTSATPAPVAPIATFEGDSGDNSSEYLNVANVVTFVGANHTQGGNKVVRMNQNYKTGPAKSIKVYPGDKVDIEVWEYHEGNSGFGSSGTPLTTLVTAVAGAIGGVSGGAGEIGMKYTGVNSAISAFGTGGNQGDSRPAAYLNYILFDKDYKVLDAGWQLAPATTFTKQKLSFPTKEIKEAGYLYTWLSYDDDSNNYVYFDDFKVTHTPTNIIQYNEYYPFGLQTSGSWTREQTKDNNYLYNAANELNKTSGWYEMFYRGYDPALGRMLQVDPYASMYIPYSVYNYAANNPVMINDPSGGTFSNPAVERTAWLEAHGYPTSMGNSGGGGGPRGSGGGGGNSFDRGGSGNTLTINMNQLAEGAYTFDFSNGQLSNYTYFSNDDIAKMGQSTFEWVLGVNYKATSSYTGGPRLWGNAEGTSFHGASYTSSISSSTEARPTKNFLDYILDWLPGKRSNGSEFLVSGPTNVQFGIKRVGSFTLNPHSEVMYRKTWTNKGNTTYNTFTDKSTVQYHTEFGFDLGWGGNYKNIVDTGDEYGTIDGHYKSDNSEITASYFGLTIKFSWGTDGGAIFYGGNVGAGLGIGFGGSAETYYGNSIQLWE